MAESTERFEGKTPEEIREELSRFLRETLERDMWRQEHGTLRHVVEDDQAERSHEMKAKDIVEQLQTQSESRTSLFEKEVVVRVGGRDYAIRSVDVSTSSIILEGGEEITHEDTLAGLGDVPGGPEGEGVEPSPPEATRQR